MKNKMKRTAVLLFVLALVFGSADVFAGETKKERFSKPLKAENVKIAKKVLFSDAKGKPASNQGVDKKVPVASSASTGILGMPAEGQKYAVVVGICDYPGTSWDLCLSDGDAHYMSETLEHVYGYDPANIFLLRDLNATFENIRLAVESVVAKALPGDEVVFFYSGHGTSGNASDEDVETVDEGLFVHDGIEGQIIWDGQLKEWFSGIATERVVFAFDTCLAGGMNDVQQEGRIVVMSSSETQSSYVFSNGELGEGLFSHYFVNLGMLQGKADGSNPLKRNDPRKYDGTVAVEESFEFSKNYISANKFPNISDKFFKYLSL
jgi:hypothetical protein